MRSLTVHAALLAGALVLAFLAWTGGDAPELDPTLVEVWSHDPANLDSILYRTAGRRLQVQRRARADGSYLWGIEATRSAPTPSPDTPADSASAPPAPASAGAADAFAPPGWQVEQYPLGEQGAPVVEQLARLRVLRDLGEPSPQERAAFGLKDVGDTLTLVFRGGERRALAIGGRVVGGGHRYVLDTTADRVYVLPTELLRTFELPASLRLGRLLDLSYADVRRVVLRTGATERVMEREGGASADAVWREPGSAQPDQAFANFMTQLDGLWASTYRPDVDTDTLEAIVRLDYFGERDRLLSTVELFRARAPGAPPYFVKSTATVVAAEAYAPVAERVEQDVRTLFARGRETARSAAPRTRGSPSST